MSDRIEILLSGHGGQGVVRLGQVLGLAGSRLGLGATMLVSHGTETRGGYVRSQVVLARGEVDSPVVERADCFCAMTQAAYERFHPVVRGTLLYDPAVVTPGDDRAARRVAIAASATAAGALGNALFANVIFLGAVTRVLSGTLDRGAVAAALRERIPRCPEENARAFEHGWNLAG